MIKPVFQMRLALVSLLMLLLGACSTVVQVPTRTGGNSSAAGSAVAGSAASAVSLDEARAGYARVLQRHVNDQGQVDFAALRDDTSDAGLGALENYVQAIAAIPLDAAPTPRARLAHMVNAYNALSMYNVIASGIPPSHNGFAKVRFFVLRKFVIGGTPLSLYDFENSIIRKLGEPRVPVLPRAAFSAGRLDEELERETRSFFARASNLRIDDAQRTVFFNEILKFYTEDFVPAHGTTLIAYAQRYTDRQIPVDYAIAFSPYDWTIANSRRP